MHGKNRKYSATGGRKARRERALERLIKSNFTPKLIKGKERNEKNWNEKKEKARETLESRIRGAQG
jgi:predicted nuclease of restriction endonuclease-like (RecB) superfamily